jgi:hypothetical protein
MRRPLTGTIRTDTGFTVTLPDNWQMVGQRPYQFIASPKGRNDVAVEFNVTRDPTKAQAENLFDLDVTAWRLAHPGMSPPQVQWMGVVGIAYEKRTGAHVMKRTEVYSECTYCCADYDANDPLYVQYQADADKIVASIHGWAK